MKKIVFLTGTRADYGKMKSLMLACEKNADFETYIYVSGMHLLKSYGNTYKEILKENFSHTVFQTNIRENLDMDENLALIVEDFSKYIKKINPDLIIVHGDRIDALGGAIVAMLNSILLAHIEGGEVTGTVDEAIRHSISKMANIHFTANEESFLRLKQLGEDEKNIYTIGSPDIDLMLHSDLPDIQDVKKKFHIPFSQYAILIFHPVVSELDQLSDDINSLIQALKKKKDNYIVILPNNDNGSEIIRNCYNNNQDDHFIYFPSLPFEDFISLLKKAEYIIGNSSCGVREACVFGVPAIDIGTRQKNRYPLEILANIQNVNTNEDNILDALFKTDDYRVISSYYGDGNSTDKFMQTLNNKKMWESKPQKTFVDTNDTQNAIRRYHNEVCF